MAKNRKKRVIVVKLKPGEKAIVVCKDHRHRD